MPTLRPFQREDVDFIKQNGMRALLASAPGTGKTAIAVRCLAETYRRSLPAVVICPASVTRNWVREFKQWAPGIETVLVEDMDSKLVRPHSNLVYIMSWALLDARWTDLLRIRIRTVVADEAHYAKNPDAQRSQALFQLAQTTKRVLLLTGTPIVNTRDELRVLNGLLGENPPMIRRLLEDVAKDIPQKKRSYLHVRLRPKHQTEYDKADQDFEQWLRKEKEKLLGEGMAEYEVERALAAEALAKIGYLRRLSGSFKVPAALDWISRAVRLGEPVVVFLEHQEVLRKLTKGLKKQRIRHAVVEGSTSSKKRQEMIDRFQRHEYPVFIGTKAAKEGITLHAARHLLFIERFYTSAEEEQAEDRIRRIGQRHETTIWYLQAMGTVDDRLDAIVQSKRRVIRTAIGSADVEETTTGNVEALIHQWGKHTATEDPIVVGLGQGKPLAPLPSPKITHGIVFYGARWKRMSALNWCRMNGYVPERKVALTGRFKLVIHPIEVFRKNQFTVVEVSKDIRIITGNRLSRSNERRVRLSLKAAH
jgi:SNF2 family DNA or RNA helicase